MSESTTLGPNFWIEGQGDAAVEVAPEPINEFPSAWHREAYINDLRRSIASVEIRLTKVGLSEWAIGEFESEKQAALAELKRLGEK